DQQVALGPLMQWDDDDEALVPYAGTVANTDIRILKAGAASEVSKDSGGATHTAGGLYRAVLSADDTDTLGPLSIRIGITGVEPFVLRATVVPAAVYDALVGGDPIHANLKLINDAELVPATDIAKESTLQTLLDRITA